MSDVINNGIKLVGETMLPGASLLLDGNLVNGAAHVAVGAAAAAFVAPWPFCWSSLTRSRSRFRAKTFGIMSTSAKNQQKPKSLPPNI